MTHICRLADFSKLLPKGSLSKDMDTDSNSSVGVTAAMEGLSTADMNATSLAGLDDETNDSSNGDTLLPHKKPSASLNANVNSQMKQMKPLLNTSSRCVYSFT